MNNNLYPNLNPSSLDDLFATVNQMFSQYLTQYVYTVIPCEVVGLQENNSFVNVKPVLQHINTLGDALNITENDILYNVPLMTLYGNKCEISFLVEPGDKGLLLASKYDISNYKQVKVASPIASPRQFSFSDGLFIPLDFKSKQNGIVLRNEDTKIHILPTSITDTTSDKTVNAGSSIVVNTVNATVTASASVTVNSPSINLGGSNAPAGVALGGSGGAAVARVGDDVEVYITGGSSAGTWSGKITSGSSNCAAV